MSNQNNQIEICPAQQYLERINHDEYNRRRTLVAMCMGDENGCNRDGRDFNRYSRKAINKPRTEHVLEEAKRRYEILGLRKSDSRPQKPNTNWDRRQLVKWLQQHPIENPECKAYLRQQVWTLVYEITEEDEDDEEGEDEEEGVQHHGEEQGGQEEQQQGGVQGQEEGKEDAQMADEPFYSDNIRGESELSSLLDGINVRESNETSVARVTSTIDEFILETSQSHDFDGNPTFTYYMKSGYDKRVLLCVVLGESIPWSDFRRPPYTEVKKGIRSFKPTIQLLQHELQRRVQLGIPTSSLKDMNGLSNWLSKHPVCTAREKHYFEMEVQHFVTTINPQLAAIVAKQPPNAVAIGGGNNNSRQQQLTTIAKPSPHGGGAALKDDSTNSPSWNHPSVVNISGNSSNSNSPQSTVPTFTEGKDGIAAYAPLTTNGGAPTQVPLESQSGNTTVHVQIQRFLLEENDEKNRRKFIMAMAVGLQQTLPLNPELCERFKPMKKHLQKEATRRFQHMQLPLDDAPKAKWSKGQLEEWLQQHPISDPICIDFFREQLVNHFGVDQMHEEEDDTGPVPDDGGNAVAEAEDPPLFVTNDEHQMIANNSNNEQGTNQGVVHVIDMDQEGRNVMASEDNTSHSTTVDTNIEGGIVQGVDNPRQENGANSSDTGSRQRELPDDWSLADVDDVLEHLDSGDTNKTSEFENCVYNMMKTVEEEREDGDLLQDSMDQQGIQEGHGVDDPRPKEEDGSPDDASKHQQKILVSPEARVEGSPARQRLESLQPINDAGSRSNGAPEGSEQNSAAATRKHGLADDWSLPGVDNVIGEDIGREDISHTAGFFENQFNQRKMQTIVEQEEEVDIEQEDEDHDTNLEESSSVWSLPESKDTQKKDEPSTVSDPMSVSGSISKEESTLSAVGSLMSVEMISSSIKTFSLSSGPQSRNKSGSRSDNGKQNISSVVDHIPDTLESSRLRDDPSVLTDTSDSTGSASSRAVENKKMVDATRLFGSYTGSCSKRSVRKREFTRKPHGKGRMEYNDGTVYDGGWKRGTWHGSGTLTFKQGDHYAGEFKSFLRDGHGMMRQSNGQEYEGEWKQNKRHGEGSQKYLNGDVYSGEWKDDSCDGEGHLHSKSGSVYRGSWVANHMSGKGVFQHASGWYLNGMWESNKWVGCLPNVDDQTLCSELVSTLDSIWSFESGGVSKQWEQSVTDFTQYGGVSWLLATAQTRSVPSIHAVAGLDTKVEEISVTIMWFMDLSKRFVEMEEIQIRTFRWLVVQVEKDGSTCETLLSNHGLDHLAQVSTHHVDVLEMQGLLIRMLHVVARTNVGPSAIVSVDWSDWFESVKTRDEGNEIQQKMVQAMQPITKETWLHHACRAGQHIVASVLLASGVAIDSTDNDGQTALHRASRNGHHDVVDSLLKGGASIDMKDEDGRAALHLASYNGHEAVVDVLLKGGGSIDMKDNDEWTALHLASRYGHEAVVDVLLNGGASIDMKDNYNGRTALHDASDNGHQGVVDVLLKGGASIDMKDNYNGRTALHDASRYGHQAVVDSLLKGGASINMKDNYGRTALHDASRFDHKAVVDSLLKGGASIDMEDNDGWTAVDYGKTYGLDKLVDILSSWSAFNAKTKEKLEQGSTDSRHDEAEVRT